MEFDQFSKSIKDAEPPATLNNFALSLWYDAKGDWEKAHTIIQDIEDSTAAWIHAYLHRKEGDDGNAATGTSVREKKCRGTDCKKNGKKLAGPFYKTTLCYKRLKYH